MDSHLNLELEALQPKTISKGGSVSIFLSLQFWSRFSSPFLAPVSCASPSPIPSLDHRSPRLSFPFSALLAFSISCFDSHLREWQTEGTAGEHIRTHTYYREGYLLLGYLGKGISGFVNDLLSIEGESKAEAQAKTDLGEPHESMIGPDQITP